MFGSQQIVPIQEDKQKIGVIGIDTLKEMTSKCITIKYTPVGAVKMMNQGLFFRLLDIEVGKLEIKGNYIVKVNTQANYWEITGEK